MRVKGGVKARRKHNRILAKNKGYRMSKRKLIQSAKEAALHAGAYAYVGRKDRKRDFRRLWIVRISETLKKMGLNYSRFKHRLLIKRVELNSKVLADLALNHPEVFQKIVDEAKR